MSVNGPKEIVQLVNKLALKKEALSSKKIVVLSFLAGAYIAFGGLLSVMIGGGSPAITAENPGLAKFIFGSVFPIGLMLVVLAGAELFTGNNAYFMPNVLNQKQKLKVPLKNWSLVYVGNFLGSIFIAFFLVHLTDLVKTEPWSNTVHSLAISKTTLPFYKVFLKGIGANWLVCLALWLGLSANNTSGKILGIWWPVMAFVTMGFEHSIANMFFIPLAIFEGADISWFNFLIKNLIPSTLGNIVGGAFFVGTLYWYIYSKPED